MGYYHLQIFLKKLTRLAYFLMLIAVVNLIPFSCRRNRPTFFSGVEMSMSFDTVSADDIQFLLHLAKMALTNNEKKGENWHTWNTQLT